MESKIRVRISCPHYWPKLKPAFPCNDCPYPEYECFDLCPRFEERRDALGDDLGSCPTCENEADDCIWLDPPPELRALIEEGAPHWQIRRWLKEWLRSQQAEGSQGY